MLFYKENVALFNVVMVKIIKLNFCWFFENQNDTKPNATKLSLGHFLKK